MEDQRLVELTPLQRRRLSSVLDRFLGAVFHVVNEVKVEFHWKRARLFDKRAAQAYHDVCLEDPVLAKVEGCRSKPKSKWRPLPMDTVVRAF